MLAAAPAVAPAADPAPIIDLEALGKLPPAVAIVALAVILIGIVGFYFGEPIRARLAPKKPPPAADAPAHAAPPPTIAPVAPVLDRAAQMTDAYIADLKAQRDELRVQLDEVERELRLMTDDRDHWREQAYRRGRT